MGRMEPNQRDKASNRWRNEYGPVGSMSAHKAKQELGAGKLALLLAILKQGGRYESR